MKPYAEIPLTPRMRRALESLANGEGDLNYVGRPTKQRLAKYGLAQYVLLVRRSKGERQDWDGPQRITAKGLLAIGRSPSDHSTGGKTDGK